MKTKIVFGAAVGAVVSVAAMTSAFALDYRPAEIAQLQGLDKITARISTFEVPVGQMAKFGTLSIRVDACYRTPPEERPESASFLEISDQREDASGTVDQLFSGWMFASTPGLSALEHPVYDVWVKECIDAGDQGAGASEQGQPAPAQ
ncbi:hypothetical protein SAMN02744133_104310 [Thalassospira xiamenensis M-5 = DSM 17429]|uniref:Cellulase n=1 Tax=Thalassospira xiamenensis M-5 = DSM 17429 TaxID=1123366 RepID=A0AB72UC74_9PROT|nr:DUF2155 domain-containing protein [Thalassospira xiamenensis]AJD51658.1 hypothetical protein TH3_07690 [Thalassospira xiamenensis M-5 = DSM 17429]SIT03030.1 hypothetical protein SAMN02744133_104310 [Thalassospira xiamenensis M-5 = DSM 17429]